MRYPVLLTGAHPDDIEFGMGAAVPRLARGGLVICYIASNGGYKDHIGNEKRKGYEAREEAHRALNHLGVERVVIGRFKTKEIGFDHKLIGLIEEIISRENIASVVLPWHGDHHQDHRALHHAALAAARRVSCVFGYSSGMVATALPVPFVPNKFLAVDDGDLALKIESCRMHVGEWDKYDTDGDAEELLRARVVHYGRMAGIKLAEALVVYREVS